MVYRKSLARKALDEQIVKMYPTTPNWKIAKELGCSIGIVRRVVKAFRLQRSAENLKRVNEETYRYIAERASRTRRMEEFRVKSGMPQQTKTKIRVLSNRVYHAMWYLRKYYNYFYERDKAVLYYDSSTSRHPDEQHYTNKYGIKFEQAN